MASSSSQFGKAVYEEIDVEPNPPKSPSSPLLYSGDKAALAVTNAEDNISRQLRRASKWQPPPGAWITKAKGTFYHHGIYIGGKVVIDYNDKSKINRTSLLQFKAGKSLFRVTNKGGPKPLKQEEVVKRALEAFETSKDFGRYHVKSNNCEHFATYCKYGVRFSLQVDDAMEVANTGAGFSGLMSYTSIGF